MSWDVIGIALLAGAATWVFRVLPTLARTDRLPAESWLHRFLGATGPAAIGTLFIASILPMLVPDLLRLLPVAAGTLAVVIVYAKSRSVVAATLAGAVLHGLTVWLLA
jgi:branched-subunit amino acid transport protein